MRIKSGIILLIFVMLFSMGGCTKQGDSQKVPAASPMSVVQEKGKSLGGKAALASSETKQVRTTKDKVNGQVDDKSIANLDGANIAAPKVTEAMGTEQPNQAKISITGPGIKANQEFTLKELKQIHGITVSANYFSRGAEKPGWAKAAHTDFAGVFLYELLADYVGLNTAASQVKIIAEDNYMQIFSIEDIKANYIDETDSSKKLHMMIAWSQNGQAYDASQGAPFRLVMGQQFAGDYNRQKWVDKVTRIVVE